MLHGLSGTELIYVTFQVGLAFLAGVAFCILLIPVNRWLAVKIGQLSTSMMAEKDHRVKVHVHNCTRVRMICINVCICTVGNQ